MASRVAKSIVINRPIEDVFAVLTDVENTEHWFPARVKEWWTSEPPRGVGSTRRAVTRVGWFRSENDAVVTAYEPPRLAAMRGTSRNAPFHATLEFEDANGGTRVDVAIEIFGAGSARLFMGIFVRWYGNNWERGLIELKRQIESCEL